MNHISDLQRGDMDKNLISLQTQIEFMDENIAEAAVGRNPYFQWVKIIVTDDKPNLNKQRVPKEEFANIISSGLFTPIKMTWNKISPGHKEAFGQVIGTVTQLTEENDRVIALAALWKKERPEDIELLKDMYKKGAPPNVSWELSYSESSYDDDGVETLLGTSLTGMAVVSSPAYAGRTSFVAMSSAESEEDHVEELEQLKEKITALETELAGVSEKLATSETELTELRSYKETAEAEKAAKEKFDALREKFTSAGVEKDDEYFEKNKAMLLALSEEQLDFMLQELVAFSKRESTSSTSTINIPNVVSDTNVQLTPVELGRKLREKK